MKWMFFFRSIRFEFEWIDVFLFGTSCRCYSIPAAAKIIYLFTERNVNNKKRMDFEQKKWNEIISIR